MHLHKHRLTRQDFWPDDTATRRSRLYHFLYEHLSHFRTKKGVLDVRALADAMSLSPECVYKWLRANRVPARRVSALIGVSRGQITIGTLVRYIITE